ncbi:putative quinol monooxygenase [Aestuariibius sp. HNIBRBA575]|uniref:putative quinol monooxygenase n=1 Tax=Aestuariibius sp. HNIBRBA575 TaxID=3233343 RepID=UPI0034A4F6AD
MFAVTVTFMILPGQMDRFLPLMIENARTSLQVEPSCQQFDVCRGDDPDVVFLYEIYDDRAAFDLHLASPHFQTFDAAVQDMIAHKDVRLYSQVQR